MCAINHHDVAVNDGQQIGRSLQEPDQFGELFYRHYAVIQRFIQRRIGPELSDDLAAETFSRAFAARSAFDTTCSDARPWLFGIASNLLRMHARTELRRLKAYGRSAEVPAHDFSGEAIARVFADHHREPLKVGLSNLSKRDRDVVLLYAWADLSLVEIAEALRIPEGTARSRLARARKQLSRALEKSDSLSMPLIPKQEPTP